MKQSELLWVSPPGHRAATDPEDDPGVGLSALPAAWRAPRHPRTSPSPTCRPCTRIERNPQ